MKEMDRTYLGTFGTARTAANEARRSSSSIAEEETGNAARERAKQKKQLIPIYKTKPPLGRTRFGSNRQAERHRAPRTSVRSGRFAVVATRGVRLALSKNGRDLIFFLLDLTTAAEYTQNTPGATNWGRTAKRNGTERRKLQFTVGVLLWSPLEVCA